MVLLSRALLSLRERVLHDNRTRIDRNFVYRVDNAGQPEGYILDICNCDNDRHQYLRADSLLRRTDECHCDGTVHHVHWDLCRLQCPYPVSLTCNQALELGVAQKVFE